MFFEITVAKVRKWGKKKQVKSLIAALENRDRDIRETAALELGCIKDARAVEPLFAALKDKDEDVRFNVAEALSEINDPRTVKYLINDLEDKDGYNRKIAAEALGVITDSRAVEPLISVLNDQESNVRREAAYTLGKIEDSRAVMPLIAILNDQERAVRGIAALALGYIKDSCAVKSLIDTLKDKDEYVRMNVAGALGEIKDSRAVEPLIPILKDQDKYVRKNAAEALGEEFYTKNDEPRIKALFATLCDRSEEVRHEAATSLAKIGGSMVIELLINALDDQNYYARDHVIHALKRMVSPYYIDSRKVNPVAEDRILKILEKLEEEPSEVREEAWDVMGNKDWPIGSRTTKITFKIPKNHEEIIRKIQDGASFGMKADTLITELIEISKLGLSDGSSASGFLTTHKERTREIGEQLNTIGGMDTMNAACYIVRFRNDTAAEELWAGWNGIGNWRY